MYIEDDTMPYNVVLDTESHQLKTEMWRWCKDKWGMDYNCRPNNWAYTSTEYGHIFKFKSESDRTLFLLTWGQRDSDNL